MNTKTEKWGDAYVSPELLVCNCRIELGFAGSGEDFNDLDFDKRDEE